MHRFLITAVFTALLFHTHDLQAQQIPPGSDTRIVVISDFNSSYGSTDYPWHVDSVIARDFWLDPAHDPLLEFHDRSHFPFYFSFVHNDLFLVSWYASSVIDEDQKNWLQGQLSSWQARDASMRILVGHLPVHAVAEGLAAGLLYITLETVGSPNGTVRAHLYPSGWSCDASWFGMRDVPHTEHTGSGYNMAWNRVHPLTAEPVFYSVDVAADSAFTAMIDRIPAGTSLRLLFSEQTRARLAARADVTAEQLFFRITATDGAVHCSSPPFQLKNP